MLAFVIGDARIIDVDRHTFDADIDPTAGLPHRDNQLRLQVLYRRVERRQRLAKHAGKLPGGHRLASNHSAVKLLHHFREGFTVSPSKGSKPVSNTPATILSFAVMPIVISQPQAER